MHEHTRKKTDQLVKELTHLFDSRLLSVCVYGSAASDKDPLSQNRDINVLAIVIRLELRDLEKASSVAKWWQREAGVLPIFITLEEWQGSHDVFAIEYADIRDWHEVVFGQDFYQDIHVDERALRLLCEMELHRKLVAMRQQLLVHRDKPTELLTGLHTHIGSIAAVCRGVLRLKAQGNSVPQKPEAVFNDLKTLIPHLDDSPFQRLLAYREKKAKINPNEVAGLMIHMIEQLGVIVNYVDGFEGSLFKQPQGVH